MTKSQTNVNNKAVIIYLCYFLQHRVGKQTIRAYCVGWRIPLSKITFSHTRSTCKYSRTYWCANMPNMGAKHCRVKSTLLTGSMSTHTLSKGKLYGVYKVHNMNVLYTETSASVFVYVDFNGNKNIFCTGRRISSKGKNASQGSIMR